MKKLLSALVVIVLFAGIGFFVAENKYKIPTVHSVNFVTVVSADPNSSAAEKESASHFLSETIIGWTHSPSFVQQLGFSISSKKQERQNFIIEFDALTEEVALENSQKIQHVLKHKLEIYNNDSLSHFSFIFESPSVTQNTPQKIMWIIAGGGIGFFLFLFFSELFIFKNSHKKKLKK